MKNIGITLDIGTVGESFKKRQTDIVFDSYTYRLDFEYQILTKNI